MTQLPSKYMQLRYDCCTKYAGRNLMSTVQEYKKKLSYEVLIRYLETTLKSQLAGTKLAVS